VCLADGRLTVIDGDRLRELYYGGAAPEDTTEKLLVNNREWLRIYVKHALGEWPITILEAGPLPAWDAAWLRAVGETDEEAAVLRRLTDPALAWEIDAGKGGGRAQVASQVSRTAADIAFADPLIEAALPRPRFDGGPDEIRLIRRCQVIATRIFDPEFSSSTRSE
jgi:hypothetical protein